MKGTHYLQVDYRSEILNLIISAFQRTTDELEQRMEDIYWYDGGWYLEDLEPVLGLAFIAYQNYINSSIYDRCASLEKKNEIYKKFSQKVNGKRTEIEVIIAIANYYKHRDDANDIHSGTSRVLNDVNLLYSKSIIEPEKRSIIEGTMLLCNDCNLSEITKKVTDWRKQLWDDDSMNEYKLWQ